MFNLTYKRAKPTGFTLIELLVVIAIIGLLAGVVLASFNTVRKRARDTRRLADVKEIQNALELYFDSNSGTYPAVLSSLVGATACGTAACIAVEPLDPSGTAVHYAYASISTSSGGTTCTSYHLGASLEDSSAAALNNDADAAVSTTLCSGSGADFSGADTAACGSITGTVGTHCYDVKP